MTAVSVSTRRLQSTWRLPERIHSSTGTTVASLAPDRKPRKIGHDSAQLMNSAPVVIALAGTLPIARPPRPAVSAASSGRKTMRMMDCMLPAHLVGGVDRDGTAAAEEDHQDCQPDRGFGSSDGEHEHGEDLPLHVAEEGAEGDEVDVDAEQQQFDRHQHQDDVAAVEKD